MKRILSLVLVLVLVLGSVPVVFADDTMTDGEKCQEAGLVAGDENGNLNEGAVLTREQMVVLIAQINGLEDEAKNYEINSTFSDVNESDWFAPYVAFAEYKGWTSGIGDGKFGVGQPVSAREMAAFMLRALDYEVNWETALEQAEEVGIEVVDTAEMTRGEAFVSIWDTVNLPKEGKSVALGVELGKLKKAEKIFEGSVDVPLDEVNALGLNVIEVIFDGDVEPADLEKANFMVMPRGTENKVAVENVIALDSDRAFVYTAEGLKEGAAYTISLGGDNKMNFTAALKETAKPKVENVKGTDTERVEVQFDMYVDHATATNVENYSIDKIGTVTAAKLKDDNKTVELTVVGFQKARIAKMTIENVANADGVVMSKVSRTFYSKFDNAAPKLDEVVKADNNEEVIVYFEDAHGVDKKTAEDISNYSIEGLQITKAKAKKKKYDKTKKIDGVKSDYYQRVVLTTSEQKSGKQYTLKVLNMVDGSTSKNEITKALTKKFYGGKQDKEAPKVASVTALSLNLVEVRFNEKNDLDPVSALNTQNYVFTKGDVSVDNVIFRNNEDDSKIVYLATSELDEDETSYKLEVNNISDVYGNEMSKAKKTTINVKKDLKDYNGPTKVKSIESKDIDEIIVKFENPVTFKTAEDPTNYMLDGGIGGALSAEMDEDNVGPVNDTVIVKFPELVRNKTYELTVSGVENFSGYAINESKMQFVATANDADTDEPEVESVDKDTYGVMKVTFSETVKFQDLATGAQANLRAALVGAAGYAGVAAEPTTYPAVKINNLWFPAVWQMGDNNEVVVFDIRALEEAGTMDEHDIQAFSKNIVDLAENSLDYSSGDEIVPVFTNSDNPDDDEYVQIEDMSQDTVLDLKLVFDHDVRLNGATTTGVMNVATKGAAINVNFNIDTDEDNEVVMTLPTLRSIPDGRDITLTQAQYSTFVTDLVGTPVKGDSQSLEWDSDDDTKPEIIEVRAVDRVTIEVVYDEDISTTKNAGGSYINAGSYKITWEDNKGKTQNATPTVTDVDGDTVELTLPGTKKLESDITYTLTQKSKAEDLSGNKAEKLEDGYDFAGSGIPHEVDPDFYGLQALNATTLAFKSDNVYTVAANDFIVEGPYKLSGSVATPSAIIYNSNTAPAVSIITRKDADDNNVVQISVADQFAFLDDESYKVKVIDKATRNELYNDTFKYKNGEGYVTEMDVTLDSTTPLVVKVDDSLDVAAGAGTVKAYVGSTGTVAIDVGAVYAPATGNVTLTSLAAGDWYRVIYLDADGKVTKATKWAKK